jgi:TPR repeat protein
MSHWSIRQRPSYTTRLPRGEDKAALMALRYLYWTGIGVVEDCDRTVEWYSAATEQGKHLSPVDPILRLTFSQQ